ncbi:unnamed protein product [Phaeothamnion confervicola]
MTASARLHSAADASGLAAAAAAAATTTASPPAGSVRGASAPPPEPPQPFGRKRPQVVFVLGGPGSGKGTQCERLSAEFGYTHLSAGELLRQERESGSPDGKLIDEHIREGKIVPVALSLGLLRRAMAAAAGARFLVDGFPRNWDNVEGWDALMGPDADIACVLFLDCPETVLEARLLSRGKSSGRTDDNLESARKRFETYVKNTLPVVEHYERQGLVRRVDGDRGIDDVFAATCAALEPMVELEVLAAARAQLDCAAAGEWDGYGRLCDPGFTAVGAGASAAAVGDAAAAAVAGEPALRAFGAAVSRPHVRVMGRVALSTVARRRIAAAAANAAAADAAEAAGIAGAQEVEETRVWKLRNGEWANVHLHRSVSAPRKSG